ncbi:unnamed protein product, partial [Rotaria sordida]
FEMLTRYYFQIQINAFIDNFLIQAPTSFQQIHKYIIEMFHTN